MDNVIFPVESPVRAPVITNYFEERVERCCAENEGVRVQHARLRGL